MKIKRLDYILIGISIIAVVGLIFSCLNMFLPEQEYGAKGFDPFREYYTNKGIVMIFAARLFFWLLICIIGINWFRTKEIRPVFFNIFLALILIIALLQWFELWYGSTFYYGEVRDKQGLGVPVLSIILQIYVCLRLGFKSRSLLIVLILFIVIMNYGIYSLVYESWSLSTDFYFPGTNIPIL
jgi:hypothetical protein